MCYKDSKSLQTVAYMNSESDNIAVAKLLPMQFFNK